MKENATTVELLKELLETPLSPTHLANLIFPTGHDFSPIDHLTHLEETHRTRLRSYYLDKLSYGSARDSRLVHSFTSVDGREAHIHNRLGHISVNPNDPYNTRALVNSYVFVDDDKLSKNIELQTDVLAGRARSSVDEDETPEICVNKNFAAAKKFVDALIGIADEQDRLLKATYARQDRVLMQQRALLLHAQRGAGKTFFENYVLSRFSKYFDEHNTIWVRLNLVEDIGYDKQLLNWINAQSAKIIMRYYDKNSMYFPKTRRCNVDVDTYINDHLSRGKSLRVSRRLRGKYEHAKTIFRQAGHKKSSVREEPISESLIPAEIATHVIAAARAAGLKFIVVLDGLDILEITKAYRTRFNVLTQQSMELSKSTKGNGFALLVVTRTNTLKSVLRADYHTTFDQAHFEQFVIESIPLRRIIEARLRYIVTEISEMQRSGDTSWANDDLESHVDAFKTFLDIPERVYGSTDPEKFLSLLETIQGTNNRAKMQMLQYRYYDFFARRKIHKGQYHAYQLVEALMKAGRRFPPVPYCYSLQNGEQIRTVLHSQRYDTRFFPSIFRYPYVSSVIRGGGKQKVSFEAPLDKPKLENILVGLRILQLIDAHDIYNKKRQRTIHGGTVSNRATVGDLARALRIFFDYEEGLTFRTVDELVEYQLIEYHHPNLTVASNRQEDNEIVPLPKLGFLLNRFLYDLAYLNMTAIRVTLPRSAFDQKSPYFSAVSYEEPKDGLGMWVAAKITNAIGLIRLLKYVNERQDASLRVRILENQQTEREWCEILAVAAERGLNYFTDDVEKSVLHEAQLALSGIQLPLMLQFIHDYVRIYCSTWNAGTRKAIVS